MVQVFAVYLPFGLPNYRAKPKSEILISPFLLIKMFYGFKSFEIMKNVPDGKCNFYAKMTVPAKSHNI